MKVYHGNTASAGIVVGPVYRKVHPVGNLKRVLHAPVKEQNLFRTAVILAKDELEELRSRAAESDREIFSFQIQILEDKSLMDSIGKCIMDGMPSAEAVEQVADQYASLIGSMEDAYLRMRSADILDACNRVVDILDGRPRRHLEPGKPVILIAERIYPSDIVLAPPGMILGVISCNGSELSHAAIIARTMGIPAIVQADINLLDIPDGTNVVLDADHGSVFVEPDKTTLQAAREKVCARRARNASLMHLKDLPCVTKDGQLCQVMGNCSGPEDIAACVALGAEEIGLVRCESLLMKNRVPSEEDQYYYYCSCLQAAEGRRVTIRTFDKQESELGDKLRRPARNPALGLRGIRTCFVNPELFVDQLCALLRAGTKGNLRVMLPMIATVEDWQEAMRFVQRAKAKLEARGVPFQEDLPFGCMMEIPSAVLCADELPMRGCKFFSIGTNDLTQFTYAADRSNESVKPYYTVRGSAVQKLVKMTVEAAKQAGIPVSICGHSACNPECITDYLQIGLRRFSVTAQDILSVKQALMDSIAEPFAEDED